MLILNTTECRRRRLKFSYLCVSIYQSLRWRHARGKGYLMRTESAVAHDDDSMNEVSK
jgi:hypothetical protein